jgi:hypothetical protein
MWAPGRTTQLIASPMPSATIDASSKYTRVMRPMRPTCRAAPVRAIPTATVVKTIGPIIRRISLMKPSPSGFIAAACAGQANPTATPRAIAASTCT